MPSLKTLRTRIRSVRNTRQITKTMKMVAAAKVRKARTAVENARPYAAHLSAMLANIAGATAAGGPLLLTGRPQVKTVRLIVLGTDRGLCGSLNSGLLKAAFLWIKEQQGQGRKVQVVAVGRKIRDGFKTAQAGLVVKVHTELGRHVEFQHAQMLAGESLEAFESGEVDEVHVLASHMVNMLTQTPQVQQVIPFVKPESTTTAGAPEYEPSEESVLAHLLPLNLNVQVFAAMLETAASEQAARMTAMDSATRNAGEMIRKLTVQYNRSRQASITKELIEIISGAEAL